VRGAMGEAGEARKKRMRTSAGMHGIRIRVDYGNGPGTQYDDISGVISLSS